MFNSLRSKALFGGLIAIAVISSATVAFAQVAAWDTDVSTITTKSAAVQDSTVTKIMPPATSAMSASEISAGSFGKNTGGGDFSFPMRLAVGYLGLSTSTHYALNISGGDVMLQGNGRRINFANSIGGTYAQSIYGGSSSGLNLFSDSLLTLNGTDAAGTGINFTLSGRSGLNQFEAAARPTSVIDIYGMFGQRGFTGPNYDGTAALKLTTSNFAHNTNTWSMQTTRGFDGGASDRIAFKYANNDISTMSGNEVLSLTRGGYLGLGNTNPSYKLDVTGSIRSASGGFVFPDGTVQTTAATSRGTSLGTKMATSQGEPTMTCTDETVGLMSLDIVDNRLYVCSGSKIGWQYSTLTR